MPEVKKMKVKVCLVGDADSGKAALFRPFAVPPFDSNSIRAYGAAVSKKSVIVERPDGTGPVEMDILVHEILGNLRFLPRFAEGLFPGTKGLLAVCNATSRKSLDDLPKWIDGVQHVAGNVPVVIAVNESDTELQTAVTEDEVKKVADSYGAPFYFTSEKTGAHVEEMLHRLAEMVLAAPAGTPTSSARQT